MKKILLVLGLGGLCLLGAAYIGVAYFLGSIVKAGVNQFGPRLTQTPVELAGATISPLTGTGTLTGFTVGNPAGWSEGKAFALGRVHVDLEPRSLFGDAVVINEIAIDSPEFNYETRIFSSNLKDLLKNIEQYTGGGAAAPGKEGRPVRFIVKKFRLRDGRATVGVGPTALQVPLPAISLDDLGVAEGGITGDQLAGALMQKVLGSVVAGTANALGQVGATSGAATAEQVKEAAKKAGETLKGLFKPAK